MTTTVVINSNQRQADLPDIIAQLTTEDRQGSQDTNDEDKPKFLVPTEIVVDGNPQILNPTTVIINTNEPKLDDTLQNVDDRPRSGYRYWLRRAFVGKDGYDEVAEEAKHPWLYFFKQEFGRHLAEFIGTFFLVFFVAGVQINQTRNLNDQIGNIDKGMTASLILTGLIFCFGHVSGAHFNPCVTLGFTLRGAFGVGETISYAITQLAGSITAAAVLDALFTDRYGLGVTLPRSTIKDTHAFAIEILITFILITVILTTAQNVQIIGATSGIAVGATFGALELFAWNFTGGSANPWRSIGPTIISGEGWDKYWIYIAGPLVGTFCAVVGQRIMINGYSRFETSRGKGHNKNSKKID